MHQNIADLIEYSKSGIISKEIIKDAVQNVTLFCMAEGTEISDHTSTKNALIYVIEGNGVFNLEGEEIIMSRGTLISTKSNAKHSLKAQKKLAFLLILF